MAHPDRKAQPGVMPVNLTDIKEAVPFRLDNGIQVFMIEAGNEEIMKLDFIFDAGQVNQKIQLQSLMTNLMLAEGSQNYTAEALNRTLDYYGAFLNQFSERDSAGVSVFFLNKHLEKILELCTEIIFKPVFPEEELNSTLKKRLQWFLVSREKVNNIASDRFFASVFGEIHPYSLLTTADDFGRIDRNALLRFHSAYYAHSGLTIIASGRNHPEAANLLNKYFGCDKATDPGELNYSILPEGEPGRKVRTSKKGAVQSAIRIGSMTINKRYPDYPGLKVVDTILGGYFGSRLMKNIREEKGFTYGIGSSVVSFNLSGYKVIATEVGTEYENAAIEEIYREIRNLQEQPVGYEELEIVRNYMMGELVRMFDGPFSLADSFRSVWEFGLDNTYYFDLAKKIKTIEPDEIIHLARTYYNTDELYQIVVGPE